MIKASEMRELSLERLQETLTDLRKAQFKLRMERANGVLEKKHRVRDIRRSIARLKTIMSEKVKAS